MAESRFNDAYLDAAYEQADEAGRAELDRQYREAQANPGTNQNPLTMPLGNAASDEERRAFEDRIMGLQTDPNTGKIYSGSGSGPDAGDLFGDNSMGIHSGLRGTATRWDDFKGMDLDQIRQFIIYSRNQARTQSAGTSPTGTYTEEQADINTTRINTDGAAQEAENQTAMAELADIEREQAAIRAQEADALNDQSQDLLAQSTAGAPVADEIAAAETRNEGAGLDQESLAHEATADAIDTGQGAIIDVRSAWDEGIRNLEGRNTLADPTYQESKAEYERLFNEYLERSKINPLRGIGAAIKSFAGFKAGISDRGLLELDYDINATNDAAALAQEEQAMRQAGAKATQDALIKTRQSTDQAILDSVQGKTQSLSDAAVGFVQPIVNSLAQSAGYNRQQQSDLMRATADLYNHLATAEIDSTVKQRLEQFLQADLPLIIMGRVNEIPQERLELYADNKELMNLGQFQRNLATAGIVVSGLDAAGNILNPLPTMRKEGGPISDNPNNEDVPDSVPAILAPGEFVVSNPDVKKIRNGMGEEVLRKIAKSYSKKEVPAGGLKNNPQAFSRGGNVAMGIGGGALGGASTGASIGSLFGPIGTAIGAGVGAIGGGIFGGVSSSENEKIKSKQNSINKMNALSGSIRQSKNNRMIQV